MDHSRATRPCLICSWQLCAAKSQTERAHCRSRVLQARTRSQHQRRLVCPRPSSQDRHSSLVSLSSLVGSRSFHAGQDANGDDEAGQGARENVGREVALHVAGLVQNYSTCIWGYHDLGVQNDGTCIAAWRHPRALRRVPVEVTP